MSMTTRVWRLPAIPGLELMRATLPVAGFPREVHEASSIGLLEHGGEIYQHRTGHDVAGPHDISFVNPLEPHASKAATPEGFSYRAFQPDPECLESFTLEVAGRSQAIAFRRPIVHDPTLAAKLIRLHRDLENPMDDLESGVRVRAALLELLRRHGDAPLREMKPEPRAVRVVQAHLESKLGQNTTLEALAALVGLSPHHLAKTFAKTIGVPLHQYLTARRIERAKCLLREGLNPAEVALEVGFFDQSHLNKKFKTFVGVTGAAYQKETLRR